MNLRKIVLKLTAFYLLITIAISIIFSLALYKIATRELIFGFRRQRRFLQEIPLDRLQEGFPFNSAKIESFQKREFNQIKTGIIKNLILFNLIIWGGFGGLSYLLAAKTLSPIREMIKRQENFVSDASHELRTPLAAMRTEIEVALRDKKLTLKGAKDLLRSNIEEINKLEKLSGALLTLANYDRLNAPKFEKISLKEIIKEAYRRIRNIAESKKIKIIQKIPDIKIKGNYESLVELIVIILDNAIKYSNSGSQIKISAFRGRKGNVIEIEDKGIGIKSSQLPYIFDPFYRADVSRSRVKTPGYGLGLAIAKRIVELHKGSISVKSKLGEGSIFTIVLPL